MNDFQYQRMIDAQALESIQCEQGILDIINKWNDEKSMDWLDYIDSWQFAETMNIISLEAADKAAAFIDAIELYKYQAAEFVWNRRKIERQIASEEIEAERKMAALESREEMRLAR